MVAQHNRPTDNARVIVFSDRHALLAELNSNQRRLSDVINDPLHKLFHLEQVKINNADRMDENVATYDKVVIKREAIQAILVMSEPARPPQQRISNFVPKQTTRIAALLPSFHIVGNIYLSGKLNPTEFILDGIEAFAVLSDATVTLTSRTDKQIDVPTAFINRAHIELATVIQ